MSIYLEISDDASAIDILRARVEELRREVQQTAVRIKQRRAALDDDDATLEARLTYIDDLVRDADRLDAMNNGGDVRRPPVESAARCASE